VEVRNFFKLNFDESQFNMWLFGSRRLRSDEWCRVGSKPAATGNRHDGSEGEFSTGSKGGLSTAAMIGIIVSVASFFHSVIGLGVKVYNSKKKQRDEQPSLAGQKGYISNQRSMFAWRGLWLGVSVRQQGS
jgi:hypothetical protein